MVTSLHVLVPKAWAVAQSYTYDVLPGVATVPQIQSEGPCRRAANVRAEGCSKGI